MPSRTPITDQVGLTLRRYREEVGLAASGLSRCAGIGWAQVKRYEDGQGSPNLATLERLVDVMRVRPSEFLAACEAAAVGEPLPLQVIQQQVRPPKSWDDAMALAAATLRHGDFRGGLLLYAPEAGATPRWAVLQPQGKVVRVSTPRGGARELAVFEHLLRGT